MPLTGHGGRRLRVCPPELFVKPLYAKSVLGNASFPRRFRTLLEAATLLGNALLRRLCLLQGRCP
jgi:hypothetical protein